MTDWQMLVEKWDGRNNFPKFTSDDSRAARSEALHDDVEVSAGVARPVHVRRSPSAVERRRPQHRPQHRQPAEVPRHGHLQRRHGGDSALRAVLGEDARQLRHRRGPDPSRSHRVRHRRREDRRRRASSTSATGRSRPTSSSRACSFRGCVSCSSRTKMGAGGRGRFHRHVSSVQERPRSRRHVRERGGSASTAYRFPELYGSLRWTPTAFDVTERRRRSVRRRRALHLLDSAARRPRSEPTARFEANFAGVDLAAFTDFQRAPGAPLRGHRQRRQVLLEWPLGRFAEHRGSGTPDRHAAGRGQPMTASLAEPSPSRPAHAAPLASGGRSHRFRCRGICRSPAS